MSLKEDISRILGPEKVSGAPDVLAAHAGEQMVRLRAAGGSRFPGKYGGRLPVAALRILHEHPRHGPRRRDGIRRRVRSRARRHQPFPGTDEPYPGDIPGRRRCRGGTGVITADLQREARALGWFYPPDPASRKECSIGGNIATNAGGPRCLKYGVTRAYVLGLTVVLASGEVVECGGRTHKNKTGFDIGDLFIGSEGMLGIITRAVLRLIPHPEAFGALSAGFPQFPLAAAAVQRILNSGHLPSALEITDSFTLRAARNYLGDSALPSGCRGHLIVEVDGGGRRA